MNDYFKKNGIYVDNSFQRRSVWVERNKARLIETILTGFPMPEIYLWLGKADPKTGLTKYSIVDGQQRLTAIRDFIANGFSLRSLYLDRKNRSASYADKSFKELSDADKEKIWNYQINTRMIPDTVPRPTIVKMFLRLNETDTSLNPPELHHAEFNGKFAKNAETIAELPFWKRWEFFKPAAIRRMGDIQFVSSILIFLRQGIKGELTPKALYKAYELYNEKYPQQKSDQNTVKQILGICDKLFAYDASIPVFFKNQVHFYPLFVTLYSATAIRRPIQISKVAKRMVKFISDYERERTSTREYRLAATEGTQKRANRETRVLKLSSWLEL